MNDENPLILAVDQSTASCAASITAGPALLAQEKWNSRLIHNQHLFEHLPDLFEKASVKPDEIDVFAAGTGPGSFAGIRTAISALRAMALPDQKPVLGVSIGETIAAATLDKIPGDTLTIIGDARRNRLWYIEFSKNGNDMEMKGDYALITHEELPAVLQPGTTVGTPDWERLETYIKQSIQKKFKVITGPLTPDAPTLASIALKKYNSKSFSPTPPLPIYMHPAVVREPSRP